MWTLDNEEKFKASWVSGEQGDNKHDPSIRASLRVSDFGPMESLLRLRLLDFVPTLIRELRMTPFEPSEVELELVANNHGAFFKQHIDTLTRDGRQPSDRMLSAVYYFHTEPKGFTGGALRLSSLGTDSHDSGTDVQPEQNMLLAFPSWWPHEVLPVSCPSRRFSDSRFNVNCWVHRHSNRTHSDVGRTRSSEIIAR
jgi:Rps23 Pro-64 3,4-dihydroxylase Tpa1-like proline 4-hydroxylase